MLPISKQDDSKRKPVKLGDEQKLSASYTEADVDGDGLSYAVSAVKYK